MCVCACVRVCTRVVRSLLQAAQERSKLDAQSLTLLLGSFLFVYFYLAAMLDSVFLATVGMMQIVLAFFPALIIYSYVMGEQYFGILNLITIFIILGIGVDDSASNHLTRVPRSVPASWSRTVV